VVASGRKHASGAASASARGRVSASGGPVGAIPDLIEPLGLVVTAAGTRLIVLDSHIRVVVAEASVRVTA